MPRIAKPGVKEARRKVLEDGLAQGLSLQDMGVVLGVCRERVRQLLREYGLRKSRPMYPTCLSGIAEDTFREQAKSMTQKKMAQLYGCSAPTIKAALVKLHLPKRLKAWEVRRARLDQDGQLWCTKCKAWKSFDQFYHLTKSKTGFMEVCAPCVRRCQNTKKREVALHVERLEVALTRAVCGCTALNCRVHGSYVQAEMEFALSYAK